MPASVRREQGNGGVVEPRRRADSRAANIRIFSEPRDAHPDPEFLQA